MSRVLLVSPLRNYPMTNEMYPSGALLLLGTLLKQHGNIVKVIHMVADKINYEGFDDILKEFNPDIVAFTVSTYQTQSTKELLLRVKRINDRIITVCGGSHPSGLGIDFLKTFMTDIAVQGEGEQALLDIAKGFPPNIINGIHYWDSCFLRTNPTLPLLQDLDSMPFPDKSLINFKNFRGLFPVYKRPQMFVGGGRGCPFACKFCSKVIYGNTLRLRSPQNVVEEIELMYKDWGVKEIHFTDDTFNANLKWAHELLDLIIKKGFNKKLSFRVALRVNEKILDLELLKHLKSAGVWFVYYGVENGNQDMLDRMNKGITLAEVRRAFKLTHSVGIKTEAFFIVGMTGETLETIRQSHDLYRELNPYWGGFSRAMPFPASLFRKEVIEKGHLLDDNYDHYSPSSMVVRTDELSGEELEHWTCKLNRMADLDKMKKPKQLVLAVKEKLTR